MSSPTSPTRDNRFATPQPTAHVVAPSKAAPTPPTGSPTHDEKSTAGNTQSDGEPNDAATLPQAPLPAATLPATSAPTGAPEHSALTTGTKPIPAGPQTGDDTAAKTEATAVASPAHTQPAQQESSQATPQPPQSVVAATAEAAKVAEDSDTAPVTATEPAQPAAPVLQPTTAHSVLDADMTACEAVPLACGEAVVLSQKCPGKETANEDGAVVIPVGDRGVVLAVADGVGGLPQGDQAARVALETLVEFVSRNRNPERLRVAIIDAIEKANRRVIALGGGAATTLSVVQIVDQRVRTYHVGDSEIFVVGGRGMIKLQTLAHGPVAYGVHCGLIDPAEALLHESRNLVSNIVGAHDMRIELGPSLKLAQRDVVLICSDGITDNLHAEEVAAAICGKPTDVAGQSLLDALKIRREQMGELDFKDDDSTFVIYRRGKSATS